MNTADHQDVNWKAIRVVIFDVDGTLYNQHLLRMKMVKELCWFYVFHPTKVYELKILRDFRNARELNAQAVVVDLESQQYRWASARSGVSPERVREVVEEWLLKRPLPYLFDCRYPAIDEFLNLLRKRGIIIAFFSDYPIKDKLAALQLSSDVSVVTTDPRIGRLKPDPKGALYIAQTVGVMPKECVVIGDRDDRDGEVARRAGMWYKLIGNHGKNRRTYPQLINEFNVRMGIYKNTL